MLLQTVSAEPLESESEREKEERKRNVWRREGCEEIKQRETLAGRDKKCDYAPKAENEKKGE